MITRSAAIANSNPASPHPLPCVACPARSGLCGSLTPQQLGAFSTAATRRHVRNGTELTSVLGAGQACLIRSGTVRLARVTTDGRQQIVGLRSAGELVARTQDGTSEQSVRAVTDLELCIVPRITVSALMDENRRVERLLYERALRDLDEAHEMLLAIGRKTARERVATFLINLARKRDIGANVPFTLSRAEIGDCLGLTVETVSRQVSRLRAEGLIELPSIRLFRVIDLEKLCAAAGMEPGRSGQIREA